MVARFQPDMYIRGNSINSHSGIEELGRENSFVNRYGYTLGNGCVFTRTILTR